MKYVKSINEHNQVNNKSFFDIVKEYNLEEYLSVLLKYNTSNDAPYHNFYHTMCVMRSSLTIIKNDKIETNTRNVLIAAMFHDFNHSMGMFKDDVNVNVAISRFVQFSIESESDNEQIIDIIKATEYPYVVNTLTKEQEIIRDADLLQMFEDNVFQQNIISLGVELNKTLKESLVMSLGFYKNVKFYTTHAKNVYNKNIEKLISDVEFALSLM